MEAAVEHGVSGSIAVFDDAVVYEPAESLFWETVPELSPVSCSGIYCIVLLCVTVCVLFLQPRPFSTGPSDSTTVVEPAFVHVRSGSC